jgi:cyclophilin family peptidyl-prolyl cis-trans isomerase
MERTQYDELYRDWRAVVGQLHLLDVTYQNAAVRRRDELRTQYQKLVTRGSELEQQVIQAAMSAYAKNPEANADLADLLAGVVSLLMQGEEYEETLRLAQLLLDQRLSRRDVRIVAGLAAFAVADFDSAEKRLRKANQEQTLTGIAARCLSEIEAYKPAWEREQKLRDGERLAGDLPQVFLRTSQGEIELELLENEAPNTVANFIYLVEQGFYNDLIFHRVIAQQLAQAGCPNGDGGGVPEYMIPCECYREDHRWHFRGSLAMAHLGRDSGGSQFYLTIVPLSHLDGNHTVFGRVVRGLEVLAKLQRREPPDPDARWINPNPDIAIPPADKIIEAKVLRKRDHPCRPRVWTVAQEKG